MSVIGMIIVGLIVGIIAKLLMPGRDPGGAVLTIILGIAGALVAGFVGRALGWYAQGEAAGFIASILGAIAILAAYRSITGRGRRGAGHFRKAA
jgi:uncharacterized membrane protein YeaQ/YmgE (transglycosylase-associated protein family)